MSDGDEAPAGQQDGAPPDDPGGTNAGTDNNNDNNQVAPPQDPPQPTQRTLSRRELADAMQRHGHTHSMHPQLVNRINAILARTLFVPPQGNAKNEEDIMDSLVVAADAINRWLHANQPTNFWDMPDDDVQPSTSTGRTGSLSTKATSKRKGRTGSPSTNNNNNRGRTKSPSSQTNKSKGRTQSPCYQPSQPSTKQATLLSADMAESYATHMSSVILFNSVFPLGRQFNRWKDGIRVFLKTKTPRQKRSFNTNPCLDATVKAMLAASIIK